MVRCIKTLFHLLKHDLFFYLTIVVVLACSLFIVVVGENDFRNHETWLDEDGHEQYIAYELEDPYKIVQASNMGNSGYAEAPVNGGASIDNSGRVTYVIFVSLAFLLTVTVVYSNLFFGRLFRQGTIRNLVVAGISKTKIFASSFIVGELLILLFFAVVFIPMVIGFFPGKYFYPIIYMPSFIVTMIACFLLVSLALLLSLFLMFAFTNSMYSIIVTILLLIVFSIAEPSLYAVAAESDGFIPYSCDFTIIAENRGKLTYYFDSDTIGRDLYINGEKYDYYVYDEPNPDYRGEAYHKMIDGIFKTDVYSFEIMMLQFEYHALVRDGVMTRYIVLSLIYSAALFIGGCTITRKKDLQ